MGAFLARGFGHVLDRPLQVVAIQPGDARLLSGLLTN